MRAVVLTRPGPPESLVVTTVERPEPRDGWVRIKVEAFGLNRSEYHLRAGMATNASFPIIPGIEATGTVDLAPGGEFEPGQQVAAMMGGMGREYDGGYAEYTVVHGTVCFTGMLSDAWTIPDFYPLDYLPNGVRLTAYGGESSDLPAASFQRYVDLVANGNLPLRIDRVFTLDEIAEAHRIMENGDAVGKLVVRMH
jgi:NADPH:quinone reductase-like Zn-dependent oxidoreductase